MKTEVEKQIPIGFAQDKSGEDLLAGGDLSKNWTTTGNWNLDKEGVVTLTPRPGEKGWEDSLARLIRPLTEDSNFDDVLLTDQNGEVLFQRSDSTPKMRDVSSLLKKPQTKDSSLLDIFHRQTLAMTPVFMEDDATDIPPARIETMLHDTAAALIELKTLQQLVQQYDDACVAQLKK